MQISCSICLREFFIRQRVDTLPCGHVFHERCISEWFTTQNTRNTQKRVKCPLCNQPLKVQKQHYLPAEL
jgi:C4-type Zn-finger protein